MSLMFSDIEDLTIAAKKEPPTSSEIVNTNSFELIPMPKKGSYFDKLKDVFSRISKEEIETLYEHFSRAWKSEELIPQPQGYILIPMERLKPPEDPVREELGKMGELSESIKREDVLQPICVRPLDDEWKRFEPVIGLRRYYACKQSGKESIPAYIREVDRKDAPRIALNRTCLGRTWSPLNS